MKNITKISFSVLLIVTIVSCTQKTTTNNKSTNSSSSGTTNNGGNGGSGGTGDTGTITGCSDGVYKSGATSCYYSNLPRMVFSGPGTYGTTLWSSRTNLPSYISQNQFSTDSTFAVRMKPSAALANEMSAQSRKCSGYTNNNFTKMKIWVMLRKSTSSLGEVKELTANINTYSNTARFTVPSGATEPFVMEVIGVNTDHRCKNYGSLPAADVTACNAGTRFFDIPVNSSAPNPTECVSLNIDFATDDTYDLPN